MMKYHTLISVGKPYTVTDNPSETYPDCFCQQLTDGVKAPNNGAFYTDPRTIGFAKTANVTIDLGDDGKSITEIRVRSLDMSEAGVGLATLFEVSGSDDGKSFVSLGKSYFVSTGDKTMSESVLTLEKPVDFRFINVVVSGREGFHFVFIDEIEIFADVEPKVEEATISTSYKNENIDRDQWKLLSTKNTAKPVDSDNVANGCEYAFEDCLFDERAPENLSFLTDGGRTQRLFGESAWVGLCSDGTNNPKIKLSLKETYNNICSFKVHSLGAGIDIKYPDYIDVFGAKEKDSFVFLGRMYAPSKCDHYAYTLLLPEYIEANEILFVFPAIKGNYWVEEIEVNIGFNEFIDKSIYPDLCFPTVTEDIFWDSADEDFAKEQNLLIGAKQQVAAMYHDSVDELPKMMYPPTPFDFAPLADGKRAQSIDCYSGEYFFSNNSTGYSNCLDFFFDIGKISTINQLNVHLLEHQSMGITRPSFINVFLSEDGDNWYCVGEYKMPRDTEFYPDGKNLSFGFLVEPSYAARFVRFRVEEPKNPRFIFIDELEAIGTKEVKSNVKRISESGIEPVIYYTNDERAKYVSVETSTVGSSDQVLYIPDYGDENTLLPLVAYLDENGNIVDTMFDGFICWGATHYPIAHYGFSESYKVDWEHLFNITFNGINGLDRLDEVVGQVKEALNIPDYKVKVYVSTLTLHETVTDFGDVDGDGISEDISKPEDRKKVMQWYVDLYLNEFAKRGYKNIVLDGFNYIDESIHLEIDNSHLVKEFGEIVKAAGTNYIWIPFYSAPRFYIGDELHFDAVCMQINYVFTNDAPDWRISSSAKMTKRLGMGIEMEHTYQCFGDKGYARQYMKYLQNGIHYGYTDGIHMYFMDNDNYTRMGYSKAPLCRMQYDATYQYIKGTLAAKPENRPLASFTAKADTILCSSFNPDDALELYTLKTAPEHGIVSLNESGDFVYYPEHGFVGKDRFSYTYNRFLAESDECVVELEVR